MSRLVDQGKLSWDEPVTQAYPSFRLGSPATTAKVRIEDLICACTGVPRKDFDWILGTTPQTGPQETFVQLVDTEPTSKYGEVFQYSNTMASAAGFIAGHLEYPNLPLGAAYDKAMQTLIFDPLGMSRTTFDMQKALAEDHASPHGRNFEGATEVVTTPINDIAIPYRPAGEAWSSPHDLIKYVENELTQGVLPSGKRFMSAKNLLQRRVHTVPVGRDEWYGMGLMDDRRYGVSVIHHGGDLIGFHSDWFAIPSAGVGAVILTNGDNGPYLRGPFERRLLEVLYGGKPEAAAQVAAAAATVKAQAAKARQLLTFPPAPAAVAGLAVTTRVRLSAASTCAKTRRERISNSACGAVTSLRARTKTARPRSSRSIPASTDSSTSSSRAKTANPRSSPQTANTNISTRPFRRAPHTMSS
jgi:CubicO group peptidase (beta-lactamase class C family)